MFDWLAVGWNLAMTVVGAFFVSLVFRSWPLNLGRLQALMLMALSAFAGLFLMLYPHSVLVLPASAPHWLSRYGDLRYVALVTMVLAFRPGWALLAAGLIVLVEATLSWPLTLPELALSVLACLGVLGLAWWQKPHIGFLQFSVRGAVPRLALVFLPSGLPYLGTLGLHGGPLPTLLLSLLNLLGFLAGVMVLRSRFRLLALGARLSRQALTDPLTGLWNRRKLEHDQAELPVGGHVMVIDLDYFKTINDRFGHDVGDEYLTNAAAAFRLALRSFAEQEAVVSARRPALRARLRGDARKPFSEQAYRIGGEEFALLTPEPSTERAEGLARHVMAQVREVRHRANPGGEITCSVGIAQRLPGETPQVTLRRADVALMRAKANGRNRSEVAGTVDSGAVPDSHLKENASRPAQPLLWEAILASLSLAALDRDLTGADWTRLLQAAILSVPGAESGTINVRQGQQFKLCAQIGFDDRLLDLSHGEREQLEWYGLGHTAWTRGQPRVLYDDQIAQQSRTGSAHQQTKIHIDRFAQFGRIDELRASLCIPVLMDGEVVGHLNLDRSSDNRRFDEEDLRVARAFADQVTVLMVAARRRGTLEQQRREQAWLLEFSLELLTLSDADSVAQALLKSVYAMYGLEGRLVLETPPAQAGDGQTPFRLALDWPDAPGAHLLLFPDQEFGSQDQNLLQQAARAANTALGSLSVRTGRGSLARSGVG
ncbi:diguanylate cyclase domain-containing protein [Deinococcus altitudinis]|uniref:diguanylate cyclase domain-containing protein n=1 Tax=Deinococcus altitudinis TaxID=468914 RepID=UPI003891BBBD